MKRENIQELYSLYNYVSDRLREENTDYLPDENAVMNLYLGMLHGQVSRKDFLIQAIKDMLDYVKVNNIKEVKSLLLVKFNRLYGNQYN